MCGICGAVDFSGAVNAAEVVRLMTPTMLHRGPDDEGISDFGFRNPDFGGSVSIGMTRLSIIDIEGGHQPVFNDDGTVGAVLNGEIYNFQELSRQLVDLGHSFRTRSDSEVLVHAYEEWGADCVERLEGMFALAIWDSRKKFRVSSSEVRVGEDDNHRGTESTEGTQSEGTLFLARDRLGIKPLYYYRKFQVPSFKFQVRSESSGGEPKTRNSKLGTSPSELETRNSELETSGSELETWNLKLETFLFGSEVRTLLASGLVPRVLSRDAVESYLLFGSVSEPLTLIEGVVSLPPGHRMTIDVKSDGGSMKIERYWSIADAQSAGVSGFKFQVSSLDPEETVSSFKFRVSSSDGRDSSNSRGTSNGSTKNPPATAGVIDRTRTANGSDSNRTAVTRVRALLEESVRKHLIADVPVGVFLSSGIDSTALAALASREVSGVHTFTVAFPESEFSEAVIARRTAQTFGTTHSEVMLSGDDMLARLPEAVGALDQPTMDGINTYFVSASAREAGLKVALSGLGGDEVFGGYNSFRRTPRYQRLASVGSSVPAGMRSAMAAAMAAMAGAGGRFMADDAARKLATLWKDSGSLPDPYYFGRLLFTPEQVSGLMNSARPSAGQSLWRDWFTQSASQARQLDPFAAVTCLEAESYLVNTLLRDTDSMSMAHSLEVRVPFLDHPLVEFVTHLPQSLKRRKDTPKALLVAALADLLPPEVVHQAKRGFTFPWAAWLRGPLKAKIENGLSELSPALREIVSAKSALAVWQSYLDGKTTWSRPWSLYVLNEWTKRNVDI
jgi:asparagine synthase (glutamine-hydrolysing)